MNGMNENLAAPDLVADFRALAVGTLFVCVELHCLLHQTEDCKITELHSVPKAATLFPVTPKYSTKPADSASQNLELSVEF